MSARRRVMLAVMVAGVSLPILIGASCPPPSQPFYLAISTNRLNVGAQIPDCTQGFVCVSVVNTACIDVEVSLYVHDGYDPLIEYPAGFDSACCSANVVNQQCACPRPGYQVGEVQLTRPELFEAAPTATTLPPNLRQIDGRNVRVLGPRESSLVQIQEGDIKSFGIAIGREGTLLANPELLGGPYFRCLLVAVPDTATGVTVERITEHVPSGETFQFVVYDQSECAAPGLARLGIRTGTSSGGGCPRVQ